MADCGDVDFSDTDLTGSDLSDEQLFNQSLSLTDAILPDGITRGRALNLIFNGDAERGSSIGWNTTEGIEIIARKYINQTTKQFGQWYFHLIDQNKPRHMQQQVDLTKYKTIIGRNPTKMSISVDVIPKNAFVYIYVKTFDGYGKELGLMRQAIIDYEYGDIFAHLSGSIPCRRELRVVEIIVDVSKTVEVFDNIHLSIEHF